MVESGNYFRANCLHSEIGIFVEVKVMRKGIKEELKKLENWMILKKII